MYNQFLRKRLFFSEIEIGINVGYGIGNKIIPYGTINIKRINRRLDTGI
ncbi:hypothetical protein JoomaDRAFT_0972 [Galbibacter orientalis DSM 19592]|uniref:Uncharacterized protein n=1 Tax=Galbibacter orientalis DSM 19592 TaxID=926559 RepID=I3C301_9FLAO|nr:hypothetical protein JoomaDRAFT_0972 [Galbibacter orientalis DSM 19592]